MYHRVPGVAFTIESANLGVFIFVFRSSYCCLKCWKAEMPKYSLLSATGT